MVPSVCLPVAFRQSRLPSVVYGFLCVVCHGGGIIKIAQGLCDVPAALAMGIGAIGGAIIGARLVSRIKPATLKTIFGFIFLYISLKYILSYFGITV